jgi:hypothetical protein
VEIAVTVPIPSGTDAWPSKSAPQHAGAPFVLIAHV